MGDCSLPARAARLDSDTDPNSPVHERTCLNRQKRSEEKCMAIRQQLGAPCEVQQRAWTSQCRQHALAVIPCTSQKVTMIGLRVCHCRILTLLRHCNREWAAMRWSFC